jgi:hypothetical protein
MRNPLFILPLALFAAGCPEQSGLDCPASTALVGQYALQFRASHDAGECVAVTDAGTTILTLDDAGNQGATLCVGTAADGGPQLNLLVPGKGVGVRRSDLLADGEFVFVSDPVVAQGTACLCDVKEAETFSGRLIASNDGGFSLQPDGGLPPVTGISANLVDSLTAASGTTGCACAFPCTVTFAVSGSRF